MQYRKSALAFIFIWFIVGGLAHFVETDFFLRIVPPDWPLRIEAVYVSGFFELAGALGLLHPAYRRAAGIGLLMLTIAVSPANIYMWLNPELFPAIPSVILTLRLAVQVVLLAGIWWATLPEIDAHPRRLNVNH